MDNISTEKRCQGCSATLSEEFSFCPACGRTVNRELTINYSWFFRLFLPLSIAAFSLVFGLQWYVHWKRGDLRPTAQFQETKQVDVANAHSGMASAVAPVSDLELDRLRAELDKSPEDLSKLRAAAARIQEILQESQSTPPALALEAVDILGAILKQVPDDKEALLMIADVSFDQKAFSKAIGFYERFLKLEPQSSAARARYGSALTFVGRLDESIRELKAIIEKEPTNFPATAYLSITYAQQGDNQKALEVGKQALLIAPNEDAKARFMSFISSLEKPEQQVPRGVTANPVAGYVMRNPIAGPKFVGVEEREDGSIVELYFRDFPMSAMPPFAKEKFFAGIKEAASGTKIKTVTFVDKVSGEKLAETKVN